MNEKEIIKESIALFLIDLILQKLYNEEDILVFWGLLIKRTKKYEMRFKKYLTKMFREQMKEVLSNMKASEKHYKKIEKSLWDFWMFSRGDWNAELKKHGEAFIHDVVESEGAVILSLLYHSDTFFMEGEEVTVMVTFDVMRPEVLEYIEKWGFERVDQINDVTRQALQKEFDEGLKLGESMFDLRKRVEKVFQKMEKSRAMTIARTETMAASNFAAEQSYIQSRVVESKVWLTAPDERRCPACARMEGKVAKLGEKFIDPLTNTPVEGPPLHPNCRCTINPVLFKEWQQFVQALREGGSPEIPEGFED